MSNATNNEVEVALSIAPMVSVQNIRSSRSARRAASGLYSLPPLGGFTPLQRSQSD
ncbi:hypothetical protein [Herbiconiux daphne]|uniref:hypothetical protein n=1 Tax=Herbiconiux daphne TaxID=2970914 RepID=UPI0038B29957